MPLIDLRLDKTTAYDTTKDGRLTNRGKLGSRQLGSYLKCRYGDILNANTKIYSSNTSRTIGSAEAVLKELNITK